MKLSMHGRGRSCGRAGFVRSSGMDFASSSGAAGSTAVSAVVSASASPWDAEGDTGILLVRSRILAARCDTIARGAPADHG